MTHQRRNSVVLVLFGLGALSLLLVFGDEEILPGRAFRAFWNLGHIAYFALFAWLLLQWEGLRRQALWQQWLWVLLASLLIGGAIEVLQIGTRRSADVMDILRDLSGSLLVLAFHPGLPGSGRRLRWGLRGLVLALLLWESMPFGRAMIDTVFSWRQFPVLADFSTPFETDRWSGRARLKVVETEDGRPRLQMTLLPGDYSGASLKDFPGDWRGYDTLGIDLELPSNASLSLTLRVHDRQHENGPHAYEYSDRFNRSFLLHPGHNRLQIPLEQIRQAPAGRDMDMERIVDVTLFASSLKTPRVVIIQRLFLKR